MMMLVCFDSNSPDREEVEWTAACVIPGLEIKPCLLPTGRMLPMSHFREGNSFPTSHLNKCIRYLMKPF